ncbi:Oidioi.mRNA.OKI2018_I69.chr2.g7212.t2.cds [Oikopleura dioica]|uniref:Oidioi.mRNA.OKI2018_I69.chr2.g7212.t2.cds n=1 Tax=Oikopleura dioica TaxID=34765 RepID=A0ABN7TA83_OIKDI|nr:Oidioi.mRNA.OKI2018_I69.chr2.g7212.t2.cds [Oikopleura dioica]
MRDTDTEDEPRSSSASSLGIPIDSLSIENISSKKKEEKIELDYSRSKSRRVESGSESDASKNDMFTFREISKFCARAHHSFNAKPHMTMSFSEWSGNEYSLLLSDLQREKENLEKKQSEAKIRPFSSSKLHTRRSSKKLKSAHSTPNVNTYLRKNTSSGTISEGMPSGYNDFMRKKVALSVAVQDIHYQFQHFPHTNSHIGHYRDTVTRKIISVAMEQQSPSVLNASPKRLTSALSEIPGSLKLLDRKKLSTTTLYSSINHPDKERRRSQGRVKVVNVCWESAQPEQPEKLKQSWVLNSTSSSSRDTDLKSTKKGKSHDSNLVPERFLNHRQEIRKLLQNLNRRTSPSIQNIRAVTLNLEVSNKKGQLGTLLRQLPYYERFQMLNCHRFVQIFSHKKKKSHKIVKSVNY